MGDTRRLAIILMREDGADKALMNPDTLFSNLNDETQNVVNFYALGECDRWLITEIPTEYDSSNYDSVEFKPDAKPFWHWGPLDKLTSSISSDPLARNKVYITTTTKQVDIDDIFRSMVSIDETMYYVFVLTQVEQLPSCYSKCLNKWAAPEVVESRSARNGQKEKTPAIPRSEGSIECCVLNIDGFYSHLLMLRSRTGLSEIMNYILLIMRGALRIPTMSSPAINYKRLEHVLSSAGDTDNISTDEVSCIITALTLSGSEGAVYESLRNIFPGTGDEANAYFTHGRPDLVTRVINCHSEELFKKLKTFSDRSGQHAVGLRTLLLHDIKALTATERVRPAALDDSSGASYGPASLCVPFYVSKRILGIDCTHKLVEAKKKADETARLLAPYFVRPAWNESLEYSPRIEFEDFDGRAATWEISDTKYAQDSDAGSDKTIIRVSLAAAFTNEFLHEVRHDVLVEAFVTALRYTMHRRYKNSTDVNAYTRSIRLSRALRKGLATYMASAIDIYEWEKDAAIDFDTYSSYEFAFNEDAKSLTNIKSQRYLRYVAAKLILEMAKEYDGVNKFSRNFGTSFGMFLVHCIKRLNSTGVKMSSINWKVLLSGGLEIDESVDVDSASLPWTLLAIGWEIAVRVVREYILSAGYVKRDDSSDLFRKIEHEDEYIIKSWFPWIDVESLKLLRLREADRQSLLRMPNNGYTYLPNITEIFVGTGERNLFALLYRFPNIFSELKITDMLNYVKSDFGRGSIKMATKYDYIELAAYLGILGDIYSAQICADEIAVYRMLETMLLAVGGAKDDSEEKNVSDLTQIADTYARDSLSFADIGDHGEGFYENYVSNDKFRVAGFELCFSMCVDDPHTGARAVIRFKRIEELLILYPLDKLDALSEGSYWWRANGLGVNKIGTSDVMMFGLELFTMKWNNKKLDLLVPRNKAVTNGEGTYYTSFNLSPEVVDPERLSDGMWDVFGFEKVLEAGVCCITRHGGSAIIELREGNVIARKNHEEEVWKWVFEKRLAFIERYSGKCFVALDDQFGRMTDTPRALFVSRAAGEHFKVIKVDFNAIHNMRKSHRQEIKEILFAIAEMSTLSCNIPRERLIIVFEGASGMVGEWTEEEFKYAQNVKEKIGLEGAWVQGPKTRI